MEEFGLNQAKAISILFEAHRSRPGSQKAKQKEDRREGKKFLLSHRFGRQSKKRKKEWTENCQKAELRFYCEVVRYLSDKGY